MNHYFKQRPWIWIVLGFSAVIAALAVMVTIAVMHVPQEAPISSAASYAGH